MRYSDENRNVERVPRARTYTTGMGERQSSVIRNELRMNVCRVGRFDEWFHPRSKPSTPVVPFAQGACPGGVRDESFQSACRSTC